MDKALRREVGLVLGAHVAECESLRGGDINEAWRCQLRDGSLVFVKTHSQVSPSFFESEARGLAWLDEAHALRVARPIAVGTDPSPFLVLEWITTNERAPDWSERLGRGLAHLHRKGAPDFGAEQSNWIGTLPQDQRACSSWPLFHRDRRLSPLIAEAARRGLMPTDLRHHFDEILDDLENLWGAAEAPARIHGDLWSGNVLSDEKGMPVLIDPACYGGHREVDLAMMHLFGGFDERVFEAYDEVWPLDPDWRQRISLAQLGPLLVHLVLFGESYLNRCAKAVDDVLTGAGKHRGTA